MKQRIWIVGGSSGIGLELVKKWLENDNLVIVSARHASDSRELITLKQVYGSQLQIINMDVSSTESVSSAVSHVWNRFDGLDIWFYNAAVYEVMSLEDWEFSHFQAMTEVNYLGAVRVMTQIMPYFEKQGYGRWIWNSSLSSYFGLPFGGGYSAPKAALLNLAEALQPELKTKGIHIQVINHGFVKTRLTAKNKFEMPELMSPKLAAQNIIKVIENKEKFEMHFPFKLSTFLLLLRLLPYKLSLAITKKMIPKETT